MTLGAIASGIEPTNLAQPLPFIDLPNVKVVNGRFFRNMELIVGTILRRVGTKAMEEALLEEIELTLGSEEKFKEWGKENSPVSITVSFDMGWNKRSSGNRYDYISGHAFLSVACLKILLLLSCHQKFVLSVQSPSLILKSRILMSVLGIIMVYRKGWKVMQLLTSTKGYF